MTLRACLLLMLLPLPATAQPVAREAYDDTLRSAISPKAEVVSRPRVSFTFPRWSAPPGTDSLPGLPAGVRQYRWEFRTDLDSLVWRPWFGARFRYDKDGQAMSAIWTWDAGYERWIEFRVRTADLAGNWQDRCNAARWVRP